MAAVRADKGRELRGLRGWIQVDNDDPPEVEKSIVVESPESRVKRMKSPLPRG
jgi:hypothetical protein